jgi:hypothetical protein
VRGLYHRRAAVFAHAVHDLKRLIVQMIGSPPAGALIALAKLGKLL